MGRISSSMMIIRFIPILFLFFVTIQFLAITSIDQPSKNAVTSIKPDKNYQKEMDYYAFVQHWPGTTDDRPTTGGGTNQQNTIAYLVSFLHPSKHSKSNTKNNKQQTNTGGKQKKNPKKDQKKPAFILRPGHVEDFGIHGLWPEYFKNEQWIDDPINKRLYPEKCSKKMINDDVNHDQPQTSVKAVVQGGSKAEDDEEEEEEEEEDYERHDYSLIKDLYLDLKKHWHSLASPYVDGLTVKSLNRFGQKSKVKPGIWQHEWEKHGTCSLFEQRAYFQKALELKNRTNLLEVLVHADIIPDGTTYSSELIRNATKENVSNNSEVRIDCNTKNQLYQIHICFTKGKMELMDCPGNLVHDCSDPQEIIFPKFPELANSGNFGRKDEFR